MNNHFTSILGSIALCLIASTSSALTIDPAQCGITLSCTAGDDTNTSAIVSIIEGMYPGISEIYKQDVGGGETGPFSDDYSTSFANSPSDPADALITWDGPGTIACPNCYLLVKDGNQSPAWYLIDISGWDGQEDLDLINFWPAQGAISHVAIWLQPIPIPASIWMFGSALLGIVGIATRRRP